MSITVSRNLYKFISTENPISSNIFCADPCGFEYNGRLYVYGTNDQQQYREEFKTEGIFGKNTYEKIFSLVCFSTDDLINWTFHGELNLKEIAPWILNSWSPAVIFRQEDDGLTHFYLYFSNTGCGVGVITATSPLGPWSDPLGRPLINFDMKELKGCPNPFDPGVCLDKDGRGWLAFGAGIAPDHDEENPGTARIVRLGEDLVSLDSEVLKIPAPYFFEASELNYINQTFVYSYNNNWIDRKNWNNLLVRKADNSVEPPSACSMSYMISKNPLDEDSWIYKNHYFKNPGEQGLNYSNNHTSLVKFQNQWYILYHTLTLQENTPITGGFRSICIDKVNFTENMETGDFSFNLSAGTRQGVEKLKNLKVLEMDKVDGTCMATSADVIFSNEVFDNEVCAVSTEKGAWVLVKNVDFGEAGIKDFELYSGVLGENNCSDGFIELRIDKLGTEPIAIFDLKKRDEKGCVFLKADLSGIHNVYFVFSEKNICLKKWKCR
ncbi:MAG: glycoside hydrolase family 43 protein [Treponema sp.]|nr:glycoside hydrolase family 43 protein [Treponema sp.]